MICYNFNTPWRKEKTHIQFPFLLEVAQEKNLYIVDTLICKKGKLQYLSTWSYSTRYGWTWTCHQYRFLVTVKIPWPWQLKGGKVGWGIIEMWQQAAMAGAAVESWHLKPQTSRESEWDHKMLLNLKALFPQWRASSSMATLPKPLQIIVISWRWSIQIPEIMRNISLKLPVLVMLFGEA